MREKRIAIAIIMVFTVLAFTCISGCGKGRTGRASFDELLKNGVIVSGESCRPGYDSLDGTVNDHLKWNWIESIASAEVLTVRHYLGWGRPFGIGKPHLYGYSIGELKINEVSEKINTAGLAEGDTVYLYLEYYPIFCKEGQSDNEKIVDFFNKKTGNAFTAIEDLQTLDECVFEFVPRSDEDYVLIVCRNETLPLKEGEDYAFMLLESAFEGYERIFSPSLVCPLSDGDTLESQVERFGIEFGRDYITVANEMAMLFK